MRFTVWAILAGISFVDLWHPPTLAGGEAAIPKDFKLTASFGSGWGWYWETTITAGGDLLQVWGSPELYERTGKLETRKQLKLTDKDLEALVRKVREADLFHLPTELSRGGEDSPHYGLELTMDGKAQATDSTGPDRSDERERRFYRVITEVLRNAPSPFPDQQASRYDPDARRGPKQRIR
ncbi:MAG: hypothetical protein NVSMB9_35730 [Isosphaeraceae bacterium]